MYLIDIVLVWWVVGRLNKKCYNFWYNCYFDVDYYFVIDVILFGFDDW